MSSVRELKLCFDADRAGEEAVARLVDQVGDRFKLSRVILPAGSDPNDLLSRESPEILREFAQCLQPLASVAGEGPEDAEEIPEAQRYRSGITETTETGFSL